MRMTDKLDPEVGETYESTATDPKEAVKIVWVTSQDERDDRLVLVGDYQAEVSSITMPQWDGWVERTKARKWDPENAD